MVGYVLKSDCAGAYLGSLGGMSFWSNIDPVGQSQAISFESEDALWQHVLEWPIHPVFDLSAVAVDERNEYRASIDSCVRAGIKRWHPAKLKLPPNP